MITAAYVVGTIILPILSFREIKSKILGLIYKNQGSLLLEIWHLARHRTSSFEGLSQVFVFIQMRSYFEYTLPIIYAISICLSLLQDASCYWTTETICVTIKWPSGSFAVLIKKEIITLNSPHCRVVGPMDSIIDKPLHKNQWRVPTLCVPGIPLRTSA